MVEPRHVELRRSAPQPLVDAVAVLVARGQGWINLGPVLDDVDPRALRRPSLFSSRGPAVPLSTVVVSGGGAPHQVGVQHGAGRNAQQQLREAGVELPAGSQVVQDHPRRGLVMTVPAGTAAAELAMLLLDLASQLTVVPLGDHWIAEVHDR